MDIDFKLLRCAVLLARHQNFGRAATALGISQPSLSRRIAALERRLGIRVFERSPGAVVATPAGAEFLGMADELVTRASVLSAKLDLMGSGRAGRLRLAAGAFVADAAVNAAVVNLIVANPTIQLEFLETDWMSALGFVMTGRVDVAILDVTYLKDTPSLRFESIGSLAGEYICRCGHPLLALESIQPEDMHRYQMVFPRVSHEHAEWIRDIDMGLSTDPGSGSIITSLAVSSCRLMYEIVAASDAISVAHPSQVRKDIESGRLAILDLPWQEPRPAAHFGMIYKQNRTLPPSSKLLLKEVRRIMLGL